jgi:hypothetical protein
MMGLRVAEFGMGELHELEGLMIRYWLFLPNHPE